MKKGLEYIQSPDKRRLDVLGASVIAPALLPIGAAAAIGVCIDTRSINPFLPQRRRGEGGEYFHALKLRTIARELTEGAPRRLLGTFDPRASAYGLAVRKYGLDEIPQLANVFTGDMSLVGFRPSTDEALTQYQDADSVLFDDWYGYFKATKPGLTGPSALYRHGEYAPTPAVRRQSMEIDVRYAETASLIGDLKLLGRTPLDLYLANAHMDVPAAPPQGMQPEGA